jgi:hypothetical protein
MSSYFLSPQRRNAPSQVSGSASGQASFRKVGNDGVKSRDYGQGITAGKKSRIDCIGAIDSTLAHGSEFDESALSFYHRIPGDETGDNRQTFRVFPDWASILTLCHISQKQSYALDHQHKQS